MSRYVLIESRDPFEYGDTRYIYRVAGDLARNGNEVTLFLIQNGVLTVRPGILDNPLAVLIEQNLGVIVFADEFSLRERGIIKTNILDGIHVSNIDSLVDLLVQKDAKLVWH